MKHYTTTQPKRYKHHTYALLALLLLTLPSLASAQTIIISPKPTEGFITATDVTSGRAYFTCGVGGDSHQKCSEQRGGLTQVRLVVTTHAPYQFVGWSGDCSGTSFLIRVTLNGTKTCSPHFAKPPYTQVAVGSSHQCALLSNGGVQCWGTGSSGQLGNGANSDSLTPVTVQGISTAIAVSAGNSYACAALAGGTAKCWGFGGSGRLGNGNTASINVPATVTDLSDVTAISAGGFHACAILAGGTAQCWGAGGAGRLGNGDTSGSNTPSTVSGITNAIAISAGHLHTCALLSGGSAKCWGVGSNGQLGDGNTSDNNTPVDVIGLSNATAISAGDNHTCALLNNGTAQCWGAGANGRLGTGNTQNSSVPVDVMGLSNAIAISASVLYTCALVRNGTAQCWGGNDGGNLGIGTTVGNQLTPINVSNISTVVSIAAYKDPNAFNGTCAILADGNAYCWGQGYGSTPTAVQGQPSVLTPSAATAVFHGYAFTAGSPYRAIANTLSGALPSWLKYSQSTGVFFGTPSAGSGNAPNLKVTVSDSALIQPPAITIPIISEAIPTSLTVTRVSTRPLTIPADVAVGAPFAVPKFIVKDQNNAKFPAQWSLLSGFSPEFTIDSDTGTISLISTLPPTAGQNYGGDIEVRFPSPSQLAIQPGLSSLTPVTGSFNIIVQVVDPSTMTLYIKIFLEGPLQ